MPSGISNQLVGATTPSPMNLEQKRTESPTVERGVSGAVDGGSRAVREEWITHRVIVNPRPPADIALFRLPARYAHVSHIAAGTFGIVVAATDLDTGKKVAIKKMFEP